jgi:hypothetical protein
MVSSVSYDFGTCDLRHARPDGPLLFGPLGSTRLFGQSGAIRSAKEYRK